MATHTKPQHTPHVMSVLKALSAVYRHKQIDTVTQRARAYTRTLSMNPQLDMPIVNGVHGIPPRPQPYHATQPTTYAPPATLNQPTPITPRVYTAPLCVMTHRQAVIICTRVTPHLTPHPHVTITLKRQTLALRRLSTAHITHPPQPQPVSAIDVTIYTRRYTPAHTYRLTPEELREVCERGGVGVYEEVA